MSNKVSTSEKKLTLFDRFILGMERAGNKLPHPFWLFAGLIVAVILLSALLDVMGVEVTYLQAAKVATDAPTQVIVTSNNLLSAANLQYLLTNFTSIYSSFAPLALVMIMTMGVGMLEQTGMISALIRNSVLGAPPSLILLVVALAGVNANIASDAGIIIVPAVTAAVFKSLGYNPWVGIIAAYSAASGGFTANLFVAGTDVLLAGITESVTTSMGIDAPVHSMMNYYFMVVAVFVVVLATVLVAKFCTEKYHPLQVNQIDASQLEQHKLTAEEKKGLKMAGIAGLVYVAILVALCIPQNSLFRADDGSFFPSSPILSSIIPLLFCFFFTLSVAYGRQVGTISSMDDIPKLMQKGLSSSLGFMCVALPASIFINLFGVSNISTIIGVKGSELLQALNFTNIPLLLGLIIVTTFINIFIGSSSSKWMLLAPVFVPMFATMGFSPALTQMAYRIADTSTNIITPISYYLPVALGLMVAYNPYEDGREVGMGSVISMCMPYSLAYLGSLTLLLIVWVLLGIDLGPGCALFM